jgi:hypothetical protein
MSATAALGRPRGGPTTRPLVEILGARWQLGAAVLGTAWDGPTAGFALSDGTLAIVPANWDGGPILRPRAEGGMEVVPARQSPPPAMRAGLHTGPAAAMVADGAGGWLSGGPDGRMVRCDIEGAVTVLADLGAPIDAVAAAGARRAAATGARLHLPDVSTIDLPASITALQFDPTGGVLACAHDGGATLWDGATPRKLTCDGTPIALAWRPDGRTLAVALQQNAWTAWHIADGTPCAREACPDTPVAVRFSADGRYLATSNTGAILCWRFDPDPEPVVCGIASRVPAGAVAWHPRLTVLAAGYQNGAVTLCQPGSADVLFVREANGDAIDVLAWSADGGALALGSRAGEIGVVALPDQVFRGAVR